LTFNRFCGALSQQSIPSKFDDIDMPVGEQTLFARNIEFSQK
jgi:hypothetical protein